MMLLTNNREATSNQGLNMAAKKIVLDLFYDVISPYSWMGFESITRHANIWPSVELKLKPVLLGFVMKAANNSPPIIACPAKEKVMLQDLKNYSRYMGVPLTMPSNFREIAFDIGSLKAMRFVAGVDLLTDGEKTEDISRELFTRVFKKHLYIHEPDHLKEAGLDAGIDPPLVDKVLKEMAEQPVKDHIKKYTDEAIALGTFGAPTMNVILEDGSSELFFGSDRVEVMAGTMNLPYEGPFLRFSKN